MEEQERCLVSPHTPPHSILGQQGMGHKQLISQSQCVSLENIGGLERKEERDSKRGEMEVECMRGRERQRHCATLQMRRVSCTKESKLNIPIDGVSTSLKVDHCLHF